MTFSTKTSAMCNSTVFLHHEGMQPCSIQEIVIDQDRSTTVKVKKFCAVEGIDDPFRKYPLFRAKIWGMKLEDTVHSVRLEEIRCHGAVWVYDENQGRCVVVILDRVRVAAFE